MEPVSLLLFVCLAAGAYLTVVWLSTESRAIRLCAVWALVGSIVLGIDAIVNSLCGLAENRSELFNERCGGSVPYIPLYAIPLLLTAPLLRRFVSGGLVLGLGISLVVAAILIPWQLLSVD